MATLKYTMVQHSGYGYAKKPGFEHGVEVRMITTVAEVRKVEKAGGILFDSGAEAYAFEESASFPEGHEGLYPKAAGTFSSEKIDGLAIYIPVREVKG